MNSKAKVFIGSSVEGLDIAYAIQQNLDHDAHCTVWPQGVFQLSHTALESLVQALNTFDFGVFVIRPDDDIISRAGKNSVARDNVIFELGLFVAGLGKDRTLVVVPRDIQNLHLPSDLLGMRAATFDFERSVLEPVPAMGAAANEIRKAIRLLGPLPRSESPPGKLGADTVSTATSAEADISEEDVPILLHGWVAEGNIGYNIPVEYSQVDKQLGLPSGSSKRYLVEIAGEFSWRVHKESNRFVVFH